MDPFSAVLLGILQGLTEWLPVSSSGHLVIAQEVLGLAPESHLVFDLVVHLGTLTSVCIYFRKELGRILRAVFARKEARGPQEDALRKLGFLLLLATIPAAVAGAFFAGAVAEAFNLLFVGIALLLNGATLFLFEWVGARGTRRTVRLGDALTIGAYQAVAIVPGISRSGWTIGGGMLRGIERETAATFAFLLSVPTLLGAFGYGLLTLPAHDLDLVSAVLGFAASLTVGLASIRYLLAAVKSRRLWVFGAYCLAVGGAVVAWAVLHA